MENGELKIIIFIILTFAITLVNGQSSENNNYVVNNGTLTIKYNLYRINKMASNQIAIWIEDSKGNYIDTIYATNYTARGGYIKREASLPEWVKKSQLKTLSASEIDTISGPTKKAGAIELNWNCLDRKGNRLDAGKYICKIEGNIYWQNMIMYSAEFEIGQKSFTVTPTPTYLGDNVDKDKLIENVVIIYTPKK